MRDLVRTYYVVIRSVLRTNPELRPLLKRCKHCRIYFFTGPQNARRQDLRCPFGCREACRRQRSTRRSVAYHRTHKDRKAKLNRRRYLILGKAAAEARREAAGARVTEAPSEGHVSASKIVKHVRLLVTLIEGRPVSLEEVLEMLARNRRQHRISRERRLDYIVRQVNDRGS